MLEIIKVNEYEYDDFSSKFNYLPISLNSKFNKFLINHDFINEFYVIKNDSVCIGLLPTYKKKNIYYSVPFFSYGLFIEDTNTLCLNELKYLLTQLFNDFHIKLFSFNSDLLNANKITAVLNLEPSVDIQLLSFKSKLRSQIKKSLKNNLVTTNGKSELLNDFFFIYSENMHNLGSPQYSYSFFENILTNLDPDNFQIFIIYYNDKAIAASICISFNNVMEVVWASSLPKYNYLSSNMLLYWEMIKYSINSKKLKFSFGRSDLNSTQLKFKMQWGVELFPIIYLKSKEGLISFNFLKKNLSLFWKYLPKKITIFIGPVISEKIY
jgi:serine/alanine adding enzyme